MKFQYNFLKSIISQYKLRKMVCYGAKSDENDNLIRPATPIYRSNTYNRYQVALESNVSLLIFLRVLFRGSHIYNGPLKVLLVRSNIKLIFSFI